MSLLLQYQLRSSETIRQRLTAAFTNAANDIRNEAPETPNHANRAAWAAFILESADSAERFAGQHQWRLLLNAAVAAAGESVTDNDLSYVVAAEILPAVIPSE